MAPVVVFGVAYVVAYRSTGKSVLFSAFIIVERRMIAFSAARLKDCSVEVFRFVGVPAGHLRKTPVHGRGSFVTY